MSRIAFVADVHLGNHKRHGGEVTRSMNVRCRQTVAVLREAVRMAVDCGCTAFAVVGDLFDIAHPEAPLLGAAAQVFVEEGCGYDDGVQAVLVKGNHEKVSEADGDDALAALAYVEHVMVIETPTIQRYGATADNSRSVVIYVPHKSGVKATDWLQEAVDLMRPALARYPEDTRILAAHVGVYDADSPAYLRSARGAVSADWLRKFMQDNDISGAFVGDYHNEAHWHAGPGVIGIHQCGALVPTGFDNAGMDYGQMLVYDTAASTVTMYRLPGPRFETVRSITDAEKFVAACAAAKCTPYVRLVVPPNELDGATGWMRERGDVIGEVSVDDTSVREHAQQAAAVARAQETLDEALTGYVDAIEMPTSVERMVVREKCAAYLNGGKR